MIQSSKYLLNLTLLVVCTQFAFASDNADTSGKEMFISIEDAQAALSDKEYYKPQEPVTTRSALDWEDDPGAYEFVATIVAGIVLDENGDQLGDDGDLFASFDGDGNVRGVAAQLIPSGGPYVGTTVYEMTMRSNAAGDLLSFKYYDASEDAVLDITETYEFVINDIVGNLVEPVFYNIGSGTPPCVDDDSLVAPFTCESAVASFGCDFVWGGITIGEACPETCGTCPIYGCTDETADNYNSDATDDDGTCEYTPCADDDSLVAPFTCASAVASFGCDFM